MNNTPRGNREHIVFYGKRNAGKSSLMNAITGQDISLVSDIKGTTTDPVSKAMELIPYGPVLLVDTGGLDDSGKLGEMRVKKTFKTLNKVDLAIYVVDGSEDLDEYFYRMISEFEKRNIEYLVVFNKSDLFNKEKLNLKGLDKERLEFTSIKNLKSVESLKVKIVEILSENKEESTFVGDIVPYNGNVILVIDNDSAAPKGRLILPQVQILRDCLDNGVKSYVVRESELESAISELSKIDLVITDSKLFKSVDKLIPKDIYLTSFSILMAREKGDLKTFIEGVKSLEKLKNKKDIKIGIAESCTHATTHEDIGRIKIPELLRKKLGEDIEICFMSGEDFKIDENFDLLIHCGSCMLNKKTMESRIKRCCDFNIPITNYGLFLSYNLGILDRAIEIFEL